MPCCWLEKYIDAETQIHQNDYVYFSTKTVEGVGRVVKTTPKMFLIDQMISEDPKGKWTQILSLGSAELSLTAKPSILIRPRRIRKQQCKRLVKDVELCVVVNKFAAKYLSFGIRK